MSNTYGTSRVEDPVITVRGVTTTEAFPMRRYLLRPTLPAMASIYAGDNHPDALHLGAEP
jgi:hypothetical protein